jgi:hypothetical protein
MDNQAPKKEHLMKSGISAYIVPHVQLQPVSHVNQHMRSLALNLMRLQNPASVNGIFVRSKANFFYKFAIAYSDANFVQ